MEWMRVDAGRKKGKLRLRKDRILAVISFILDIAVLVNSVWFIAAFFRPSNINATSVTHTYTVGSGNIGTSTNTRNIAVDANGIVYVAYNSGSAICVKNSSDSFTTAKTVVSGTSAIPEIAYYTSGNYLVLAYTDGSNAYLYYISPSGAVWSLGANIAATAGSCGSTLHMSISGSNIYMVDNIGMNCWVLGSVTSGICYEVQSSTSYDAADIAGSGSTILIVVESSSYAAAFKSTDTGATFTDATETVFGSSVVTMAGTTMVSSGGMAYVYSNGTTGYTLNFTGSTYSTFNAKTVATSNTRSAAIISGTLYDTCTSGGSVIAETSSNSVTVGSGSASSITAYNGTVYVAYYSGGTIYVAMIKGLATGYYLTAEPSVIQFLVGSEDAKPLILKNDTSSTITINSISVPTGYNVVYAGSTYTGKILASSEELTVKVSPTETVTTTMTGYITVSYTYAGSTYTLDVPINTYTASTTSSNVESTDVDATVTYDASTHGGVVNATSGDVGTTSVDLKIGDAADLTYTATRSGCTFIGWNTDSSATTGLTSYIVPRDTTLYAIFDVPVTGITLDKTSTTVVSGSTTTVSVASFTPTDATDQSITWSSSDTRYVTISSSGVITGVYPGTATVTATATGVASGSSAITATCTVTVTPRDYTLRYDASTNGGTISSGDDYYDESVKEADSVALGNVTAKNYVSGTKNMIFIGWNTDKDATTAIDTLTIVNDLSNTSGIITVYAIYQEMKLSVTGENDVSYSNGDTMTVAENQVIDLTAVITPNVTYLPSYTISWKSNNTNYAKINDGQLVMQSGSADQSGVTITVTATPSDSTYNTITTVINLKITGSQCVITYNSNGGTESEVSETLVYGDKIDVSTVSYTATKTGYTHLGWAVTSTATAPITGDFYATGNVTLYAVFQKITVSLDQSEITLTVSNSQTLVATVLPEETEDKSVTWSSNNEAVATVDQNGKVTAISQGEASITCTPNAGSGESAGCTVKVNPKAYTVTYNAQGGTSSVESEEYASGSDVDLTITATKEGSIFRGWATTASATTSDILTSFTMPDSDTVLYAIYDDYKVTLSSYSLNIMKTQTASLSATVTPSDTSPLTVTWKSEDESIATVDSTGTITAVSVGKTVVNAIADVDGTVFASCAVIVEPLTYLVTYSVGLGTSDASSEYVEYETEANLSYTATREHYKFIGWNTDYTASTGLTSYTVKSAVILYAIYEEIVPTNIELDKTSLTMTVLTQETLTATITPSDALDTGVRWHSSDENIATVDSTGTISALTKGTAVITAESNKDATITATCNLTVEPVYYTITFNATENGGTTTTPTLKVEKDTDALTGVTATKEDYVFVGWATSSSASESEVLTEYIATADIELYAIFVPLTIELNKSSIEIMERQVYTLEATVTPSYVTDSTITWTSSDTSIATVSDGVVTGISSGAAIITAKANAGKHVYAQCVVEVDDEVYTITYDATTNGGSSYITSEEVSYGLEADLTVPATKQYYYHVGWNTDKNATTGLTSYVVSGPATLYAIYKLKVPTAIDLGDAISVQIESATYIEATITPSDSYDTSLTWTSSNEEVATVDDHGRVEALALGTTIITAVSNADNTVKDTVTVTVIKKRFTVTYNASYNGGTTDTDSLIVIDGNNADLSVTASRYGYIFVGWNTDHDATEGLSSLTVTENVTLYAIYKKIEGSNKEEAVIDSVRSGDSTVTVTSTSDVTIDPLTNEEKANIIAGVLTVSEVSALYAGNTTADIVIEVTPNTESISSADSVLLLNMRDTEYVENIHFFNTDVYRTINYTSGNSTTTEITTLDTPINLTYVIPAEITVREGRGFRIVAAHKDDNGNRYGTSYSDIDDIYGTITISIDKFCLMGLIYRDVPYSSDASTSDDGTSIGSSGSSSNSSGSASSTGAVDGAPYDRSTGNARYVVVGLASASTGDKPNTGWYITLCISAAVSNIALKKEIDRRKKVKKQDIK